MFWDERYWFLIAEELFVYPFQSEGYRSFMHNVRAAHRSGVNEPISLHLASLGPFVLPLEVLGVGVTRGVFWDLPRELSYPPEPSGMDIMETCFRVPMLINVGPLCALGGFGEDGYRIRAVTTLSVPGGVVATCVYFNAESGGGHGLFCWPLFEDGHGPGEILGSGLAEHDEETAHLARVATREIIHWFCGQLSKKEPVLETAHHYTVKMLPRG